jgi:hypothetical protein
MGQQLIHQYPVPRYYGDLEKWSQDLQIWLERLQVDSVNAVQYIQEQNIRLAIVKTAPGASQDISVYLDNTVDPGPIADVTAEIAGGTALNSAVPRLEVGDKFFVTDITGGWRSTTVFQATEDCT